MYKMIFISSSPFSFLLLYLYYLFIWLFVFLSPTTSINQSAEENQFSIFPIVTLCFPDGEMRLIVCNSSNGSTKKRESGDDVKKTKERTRSIHFIAFIFPYYISSSSSFFFHSFIYYTLLHYLLLLLFIINK